MRLQAGAGESRVELRFRERHDARWQTLRMLTLIDEYTRECLAIRVARRLGSYEVIEALADVMLCRGTPETHSLGQRPGVRGRGTCGSG